MPSHLLTLPPSLSVVPIFVNAGAALLPAIIAALTSLVALLLSPKAMLNLARRKPWLPLLLLALALSAWYLPSLIPTATAVPKSIDWPSIAHDLLQSQSAPHALLTPLWHHDLDNTLPMSTPAIFSPEPHNSQLTTPTLYLPTTLLDVASHSGILFALDPDTGKQRWTATKDSAGQYLKPFFSSPAITPDGRLLVVGQGLHDDKDSPLLCFHLEPPANPDDQPPLAWSVPTPLHVESSPAIFNKNGELQAVVGAGAIEGKDRLPVGNIGYVFCVSIPTGKELWRFPLNDPESSPAVDENNTIYIGSGFNGSALVALSSDSDATLHGKSRQLWRTPTPFPATGDVALASSTTLGKIVLIGAGNGDYVFSDPHPAGIILALDRSTGKILWQTPLPDSVLGPLKTTPNNTTLLAPCRNGQAYALNLNTGQILWHTPISASLNIPLLAGLATDGPHAFALAADGTLAILNTSTGQLLYRQKFADESKSPQNLTASTPIIHHQTLYIATETTGLHAFKINP